MKHTPLGYEIIDGKIAVNEEEAQVVKAIMKNYLEGMPLKKAAAVVGLELTHTSVKNILTNKRYVGDGFYPRIIDDETALAIETEMNERAIKLGRDKFRGKQAKIFLPKTNFKIRSSGMKYDDPIVQAEYVYTLIEEEVS